MNDNGKWTGKKIRQVRNGLNMTQEEFGKSLSVGRHMIIIWENEYAKPHSKYYEKLEMLRTKLSNGMDKILNEIIICDIEEYAIILSALIKANFYLNRIHLVRGDNTQELVDESISIIREKCRS